MKLIKRYGGGGGTTVTNETIPAWARPYMENVGKAAEAQYSSGNLGKVAGATQNQNIAFKTGADLISKTTGAGLDTLQGQQNRLTEMAKTGGANELQDALKLDVGVDRAAIAGNQGASGTLGSARHMLASSTAEDATKAKFAQNVIANKAAAEQALGSSVKGSSDLSSGFASNLANLGSQERNINQQIADADWQALQRYSSAIYGNPARQQTTASGGK